MKAPLAPGFGWSALLPAVLFAGLCLRLPFLTHPGFDDQFFTFWADGLLRYGLGSSYQHIAGLNYPPLYLYFLDGLAHLFRWQSDAPTASQAFVTMQKYLNVLVDLANACLLFAITKRERGQKWALLVSALWLLNPYTAYDSAVWGQIDTFITFFLLLSLYFTQRGRLHGAYAALVAGLLTKAQMAIAVPLFILYFVKRFGWKAQLEPATLAIALGAALCIPFVLQGTLVTMIQEAYVQASSYFPYLSLNAHNLWWLAADPNNIFAKSDTMPVLGPLSAKTVGFSLFGIAYAGAFLYLMAKRAKQLRLAHLAFGAAFIYLAFYCLNTEMHERYLYPFFALWVLAELPAAAYFGLYALLSATQTLSLALLIPFDPAAYALRERYFPAITYPLTYLNLSALLAAGSLLLTAPNRTQEESD